MKEILKNRLFWIIMIIILAIAIRMFGVGLELFSDENVWAETVINSPHLINQPELYIPHPPLAVLGYIATTSMFGLVPLGFRIFPLMVGVISIIVVYLFSSELYDRKTGLITSLLMAITFYPIWASLYVDVDGNLLLLFTVLTVFSYFKFSKTKDKKFIVLTGIFLGLSMLSKYPAILIPVILLIYDFMETKLKNLKSLLFVFLIGAVVFSIFPIGAYLVGSPEIFLRTIGWGTTNLSERSIITASGFEAFGISMAKTINFLFFYAMPFIPLLALYAYFWKRRKQEKILFIYLLVFLIFYTFILYGGVKLRYLMVIIPPLYILSGRVISDIFNKISKNDIINFIATFVISFLIIIGLNSYGTTQDFNAQTASFDLIVNNSFYWYSGHGSSPFAIHIHSFIFVSVLSVILFLGIIYAKKDTKKLLIIILISLNLSYNFFVVAESFNPTIGPDYSKTFREMAFDVDAMNLKEPIYNMVKGLNLNAKKELVGLSPYLTEYDVSGTIIMIDTQAFGHPAYKTFEDYVKNHCTEKKVFYSNGQKFGYFFECGGA